MRSLRICSNPRIVMTALKRLSERIEKSIHIDEAAAMLATLKRIANHHENFDTLCEPIRVGEMSSDRFEEIMIKQLHVGITLGLTAAARAGFSVPPLVVVGDIPLLDDDVFHFIGFTKDVARKIDEAKVVGA